MLSSILGTFFTLSGPCSAVQQETTALSSGLKVNPSTILDENIMVHIFSFVGTNATLYRMKMDNEGTIFAEGGRCPAGAGSLDQQPRRGETLTSVVDAASLCSLLSQVCRTWKTICDKYTKSIVGMVDANVENFKLPRHIISCASWMCKHKVRLGRILFLAPSPEYEGLVATVMILKVLKECNTNQLRAVAAHFPLMVSTPLYWDGMAVALGASVSERFGDTTQKVFHDILSRECPNLQILGVNFFIAPNHNVDDHQSNLFSLRLFSMPSISSMRLILSYYDPQRTNSSLPQVDHRLVKKLITNLRGLKNLYMRGDAGMFMGRRMEIESETLRFLQVDDLAHTLVKCRCPELEHFICDGGMTGNGSLPELTRAQFDTLKQQGSKDLVAIAGDMPFIGMDVPPSCRFYADGFREHFLHNYSYYNFQLDRRVREFDENPRDLNIMAVLQEYIAQKAIVEGGGNE